MNMDAKDWLPILFERSNATSTLWNIEIIAILGIVAFLAGAGSKLSHRGIRVAILVGYWVMAAFNLFALVEVTEQRAVLADLVRKTEDRQKLLGSGQVRGTSSPCRSHRCGLS